ncbi:MAG: glycosyltransferase family 4 protein, partial [Flavisolibacter sp.]
LHYFNYRHDRDTKGLENYCVEIHAYSRQHFFASLNFGVPYIIRSRVNRKLINRLNQDEYPVLLEGLHTAGLIPHLEESKKIILRMHNEEGEYYRLLAGAERNLVRRMYLLHESRQIKKYYSRLPEALPLACISQADVATFEKDYGFVNVHFIPAFVPWGEVVSKEGNGAYCLYHGNMAVAENEMAALWLVENVFSKIEIPFIIAGNGMSAHLLRKASHFPHIKLVENPPMSVISHLVQDAHVNVLPSLNKTGVKLKLLHAAFEGRFCLSNSNGINGSALENGIIQCNEANEYIRAIRELFTRSFTAEDKKNRQQLLAVYNNKDNAERLNAL